MPQISMNDWLVEKAEAQVEAVIGLWRMMDDEEPNRELGTIYMNAIKLLAYATGGFPDWLDRRLLESFNAGPVEMRALVEELKERDYDGWDLPNPVYHGTVFGL